MGAEIKLETMDRMLAELESREVANPDRVSVRKAIRLYYPKLKALADEKGCRVKDLHRLFVEMTGASLTENSFRVYWNRAGRELRAQGATTGKPAKAEASPRRDGDTAAKSEAARTVQKPVSESPQAMPKKPETGTKPVAQEPKPVVETPKSAVPQDDKPASQTGHVSKARPTPGFRTDEEIRAQGQDLVRMYRESGKMK